MKILAVLLLLVLVAACSPGAPVPGTTHSDSTPDLFLSAQHTQATQIAIQATQDAVEAESRYLSAQLTATAEAPIVHITETAAAFQIQSQQIAQAGTATMQSSQATATAEASIAQATVTAAQTATAASWTATAVQNAAMIQAASQAAQQTAIANDTERNNLQLQRQRWQNQFNAVLPGLIFLVILVALGLAAFTLVRIFRVRPIARDARGDAPLLQDIVDGTVLDPDRAPNAVTGMKREDLKALPALTAADQQRVTERDQMVDLATRGLPSADGRTRNKAIELPAAMPQLPPPVVQIVPPEQVADALRPVLPAVAQDAMDAEVIPEEPHHDQP